MKIVGSGVHVGIPAKNQMANHGDGFVPTSQKKNLDFLIILVTIAIVSNMNAVVVSKLGMVKHASLVE